MLQELCQNLCIVFFQFLYLLPSFPYCEVDFNDTPHANLTLSVVVLQVPQDHQALDLSPTRQEEQFSTLAPQLQDVVRSHVYHHRKRGTRTSRGGALTRGGGASGSTGGTSSGGAGGGATGCGDGGLISSVRFIC